MPATFDPDQTSYSEANARVLCNAAHISYSGPQACQEWAAQNGFTEKFDFVDTAAGARSDTQAFVAQSPEAVLVVFRGTEPRHIADDTSDARAIRRHWDGLGEVHAGFLNAFQAAWGSTAGGSGVLPNRLRNRGERKVWIAGHSLGGALAQLCAAQTEFNEKIPVQGVYTYGQPRVGDADFAGKMNDRLGKKAFRLVNDRDIVPRVPLYLSMGYRHYGQEQYFDRNHARTEVATSVETVMAAFESFKQTLRADFLGTIFHEMTGALGDLHSLPDPTGVLQQLEKALDPKRLVAEGTENITDHLMNTGYLTLFP